jgi:tetratricopeptide (TPR) repeat protein
MILEEAIQETQQVINIMKNIKFIIILFLFISDFSFSQGRFNTYQSELMYTPRSYNELARLPMEMKRRHDNNLEYLYQIEEWIIDLKSKINSKIYLVALNEMLYNLDNIKKTGLANSYSSLKEVEMYIQDKIVNEYKKEIEKKSTIYETYEQAKKEIEGENYESAYSRLNYIIAQDSENVQALFWRGKLNLYIRESYELAINDFKKMISIYPDDSELFSLRAEAYYRNKDFNLSISDYTKTLSLSPDDTNALFMRALAKTEQGDRTSAIEDYDKIIKLENSVEPINFKISTVYNNKAYCLVHLENFNEALLNVNKALVLDKTEAYIWDTRGELYYKIKQYQKCISDMNSAILIKENGNSYYYRGLAQLKLGKKIQGCKDLSKASDLGHEQATESLSEVGCN